MPRQVLSQGRKEKDFELTRPQLNYTWNDALHGRHATKPSALSATGSLKQTFVLCLVCFCSVLLYLNVLNLRE